MSALTRSWYYDMICHEPTGDFLMSSAILKKQHHTLALVANNNTRKDYAS